MRKSGINYLTYPNIPVVIEEVEAIIEENRNDFEPDTLNNLFEIIRLLQESDHKIKLVDQLVSSTIQEEEMNEKWEDFQEYGKF